MPGNLIIKPINARLTRDTETFGTMDPFCKIRIGKEVVQTPACMNGGKNPNFTGSNFSFRITNETVADVEIWDKDSMSSNDMIASGAASLSTFFGQPSGVQEIPLTYKGKNAGTIMFQVEWHPDSNQQQNQQGFQQQQGGYNQQQGQQQYPQQNQGQQQYPQQQQGQQNYQQGQQQQGQQQQGYNQQQQYPQQQQGGNNQQQQYPQQQQQYPQQQQGGYNQQQQGGQNQQIQYPQQQQGGYNQQQNYNPQQQYQGNQFQVQGHVTKKEVKHLAPKIFNQFDRDRSGSLQGNELHSAIIELFRQLNHPPPSREYMWECQQRADKNCDGRVSEKEFKKLVKGILNLKSY